MKIRSTHIIVLAFVALGVVLALAATSGRRTPRGDEDDFLESVRDSAASDRAMSGRGQVGVMPGVGDEARLPLLVPETTEFHAGPIPNQGISTRQMMLHNRGTAQLELTDIRTTCACTVGVVDTRFIPPGGSIPMDILLDPRLMPDFHSRHTLSIYSNDLANAVMPIVVTAEPEPEFSLTPETVDFGSVDRQDGARQIIEVRQIVDREKPLDITGVEVMPAQAGIDAALERVPEEEWEHPGRPEFRIALSVRPTAPVGPINAHLSLVPNIERIPRMNRPIKGQVVSFYRLRWDLQRAARLTAGATAEGVYEIISDEPVDIIDIQTTVDGIAIVVREGGTPTHLYLDIKADAGAEPGLRSGAVAITLQSGDQKAVENLPLRAAIVRPEQGGEDIRVLEPRPQEAERDQQES